MKVEDNFKVLSTEGNVFRFVFTGFFSDELVEDIGDKIRAQYRRAVDSFHGEPFITLADLRNLKALPDTAKALVADLMDYGKKRNLFFSININPSAISSLSIGAAGETSDTNQIRVIVATPVEAEAVLAEKLAELRGY